MNMDMDMNMDTEATEIILNDIRASIIPQGDYRFINLETKTFNGYEIGLKIWKCGRYSVHVTGEYYNSCRHAFWEVYTSIEELKKCLVTLHTDKTCFCKFHERFLVDEKERKDHFAVDRFHFEVEAKWLPEVYEDLKCVVCFDYTDKKTRCKHALCPECLRKLRDMEDSKCPLCRQNLDSDDEDE